MKRARRSFMIVGCLLLVAGGVAGAHGTSQRLPPPPPELVAAARIPLLTGTVTDPAGRPIAGAAVNYRDLVRDLEGGTMTGPSGRYEKRRVFREARTRPVVESTAMVRIESKSTPRVSAAGRVL